MASKAQEKISWPVVIVCIIVAFIFFGDFVLNYFGFKGVNEVVKVAVDDIKGGSDPKIVEPKPKSKTVEVIPSTSNSSENKKTLNEQETKDLSPTFDIVRVDPEGSGLIAGVAAPGSTISLLIDGTPDISTLVPADGQFVLMFDLPQSDEPTSLSLKEKKADGTIIISSATVLINPLSKGKVPIELDPPSVVGEAVAVVDSEDAVVATDEGSVDSTIKAGSGEAVAVVDSEDAVVATDEGSVDSTVKVGSGEAVAVVDSEDAVVATDEGSVDSTIKAGSGEVVALVDSEDAVVATDEGSVDSTIKAGSGEVVALVDSEDAVVATDEGSVDSTVKTGSGEVVALVDSEDAVVATDEGSVDSTVKTGSGEVVALVDSEDAVVTITKQEVVASSAGNIGNNTIKKKPTIVIVDSTGTKVVQSTPVPISPKGDNVENVVIDTITYDDKGDVAISGRGSAGDFVRIYIDDKPVLLTSIGVDGSWVTPLTDIKQGLYKLRADEVSKSGTVLSRVETPFQRENVMIAAKGASAITVQPGYTLWAIAREKYGSGFQYVRVYQANQDLIKNPDLIYPGQVFKLPEE
jgi:nucleoid-associated protein YgaU